MEKMRDKKESERRWWAEMERVEYEWSISPGFTAMDILAGEAEFLFRLEEDEFRNTVLKTLQMYREGLPRKGVSYFSNMVQQLRGIYEGRLTYEALILSITSLWQEDREYKTLAKLDRNEKSYIFRNLDIFGLYAGVREQQVQCDDVTEDDYIAEVKKMLPEEEQRLRYLDYLRRTQTSQSIMSYDYTEIAGYGKVVKYRLPQALEIITQLPKGRLVIPGDGLGLFSIAALMRGRDYYSSEPAGVGRIARKLGIIKTNQAIEDITINDTDILILSNLVPYVDIGKYVVMAQRVVVLDERCSFPGQELFREVEDTHGVLWVKNLELEATQFQREVPDWSTLIRNVDYVVPRDVKAAIYARDKGYSIRVEKLDEEVRKILPEVEESQGEKGEMHIWWQNPQGTTGLEIPTGQIHPRGAKKPGQKTLRDGVWCAFSTRMYEVSTENTLKQYKDQAYEPRHIGKFEFNGQEEIKVVLYRNPMMIRYAYNLGRQVRVKMVKMVEKTIGQKHEFEVVFRRKH